MRLKQHVPSHLCPFPGVAVVEKRGSQKWRLLCHIYSSYSSTLPVHKVLAMLITGSDRQKLYIFAESLAVLDMSDDVDQNPDDNGKKGLI